MHIGVRRHVTRHILGFRIMGRRLTAGLAAKPAGLLALGRAVARAAEARHVLVNLAPKRAKARDGVVLARGAQVGQRIAVLLALLLLPGESALSVHTSATRHITLTVYMYTACSFYTLHTPDGKRDTHTLMKRLESHGAAPLATASSRSARSAAAAAGREPSWPARALPPCTE